MAKISHISWGGYDKGFYGNKINYKIIQIWSHCFILFNKLFILYKVEFMKLLIIKLKYLCF